MLDCGSSPSAALSDLVPKYSRPGRLTWHARAAPESCRKTDSRLRQ